MNVICIRIIKKGFGLFSLKRTAVMGTYVTKKCSNVTQADPIRPHDRNIYRLFKFNNKLHRKSFPKPLERRLLKLLGDETRALKKM